MSSEPIVGRLQVHADVKALAALIATAASGHAEVTNMQSIMRHSAPSADPNGSAPSVCAVDRLLPSTEAVTMAHHSFDGSCEGAELLSQ